jgi:hypothetical protein
MGATLRWRGDEGIRITAREANLRLAIAGRHLRDAVRRNISEPTYSSKVKPSKNKGAKRGKTKRKKKR